jgi:hypothetical protein
MTIKRLIQRPISHIFFGNIQKNYENMSINSCRQGIHPCSTPTCLIGVREVALPIIQEGSIVFAKPMPITLSIFSQIFTGVANNNNYYAKFSKLFL